MSPHEGQEKGREEKDSHRLEKKGPPLWSHMLFYSVYQTCVMVRNIGSRAPEKKREDNGENTGEYFEQKNENTPDCVKGIFRGSEEGSVDRLKLNERE